MLSFPLASPVRPSGISLSPTASPFSVIARVGLAPGCAIGGPLLPVGGVATPNRLPVKGSLAFQPARIASNHLGARAGYRLATVDTRTCTIAHVEPQSGSAVPGLLAQRPALSCQTTSYTHLVTSLGETVDELVRVALVLMMRPEPAHPTERQELARLVLLGQQHTVEHPPTEPRLVYLDRDLEHVLRHPLARRVKTVRGAGEHTQVPATRAATFERPARLVPQARYPARRYHSARARSTPSPPVRAFGDSGVPSPTVAKVFGFAGKVTTLESNPTTSRMVRWV